MHKVTVDGIHYECDVEIISFSPAEKMTRHHPGASAVCEFSLSEARYDGTNEVITDAATLEKIEAALHDIYDEILNAHLEDLSDRAEYEAEMRYEAREW